MNRPSDIPPCDAALLLRVHAEQHWLESELVPVLEQLEACDVVDEDELEAAVAYLEVSWSEASCRARMTDVAFVSLDGTGEKEPTILVGHARHYYRWLRAFTTTLARRVEALLESPGAVGEAHRRPWAA